MRKITVVPYEILHTLYIYDPKENDLRYKRDDGTAGSFVPGADFNVHGQDLLYVGNPYNLIPRESLIQCFCSDIKRHFNTGGYAYDPGDEPPSQERVRELFDYDPINGVLIHRKNRTGVTAGTVAGCKPGNGKKAMKIQVDGSRTTVRKIIYIWVYGVAPCGHIFHKDGDRTNNAIENLFVKRPNVPWQPQTHYEENSFGVTSVIRNLRIQKWCSMLPLNVDVCHIDYHDTLMDAVKDVVQAGLRHDRVRCLEVDEARAYLRKHEPEYLESLGL